MHLRTRRRPRPAGAKGGDGMSTWVSETIETGYHNSACHCGICTRDRRIEELRSKIAGLTKKGPAPECPGCAAKDAALRLFASVAEAARPIGKSHVHPGKELVEIVMA